MLTKIVKEKAINNKKKKIITELIINVEELKKEKLDLLLRKWFYGDNIIMEFLMNIIKLQDYHLKNLLTKYKFQKNL